LSMAEIKNNLDKNQKLALAGLAVFAICLAIVWLLKLDSEIKGPMKWEFSPVDSALTDTLAADDKSKSQDTDGDGLSDWDELNIYHTSPYLADSDSDGISDSEEVRNGTDPNCPVGKNCNYTAPITASGTPAISENAASSSQAELINTLSSISDSATLRRVLLQSGIDKKELDKLTDDQLVKVYQAILASSTKNQ
jgi:hypothetical protein